MRTTRQNNAGQNEAANNIPATINPTPRLNESVTNQIRHYLGHIIATNAYQSNPDRILVL